MLYLLGVILPPVALLVVGKPFQAILNLFLLLLFWIPAAVHAIFVVHEVKADRRAKRYGGP
ncbi:YqaE/Pmp3 family membrane protein [Natribacillus halophilus]|uniref:YqaE/Pmp3 family membrane protein n=1 Tax=Natribacillus halophilus TaxID=549003 RepID=UPI00115F9B73|nr:YqaE/Pmp3 family membrane protein [Natribacillus halophilus]